MLDIVRAMLKPAVSYFCIVFLAGFILGAIRVFYLVPIYDERTAELIEIPIMTMISLVSAYMIVTRFEVSNRLSAFVTGVVALSILLTFEFTVVLGMRDLTFDEYITTRDNIAGLAYLMGLILYAIFPLAIVVGLNRRGT